MNHSGMLDTRQFSVPSILLFFYLIIIPSFSSAWKDADSSNPDRAALLSLRSALRGRTLLWDLTAALCTWEGVTCHLGRVTALRLPAMGLTGTLPTDALANLTHLRTLSLHHNSLSRPIPPGISNLSGSLRNLYLQGNRFDGPIPESIFLMRSLVRLNLEGNELNGGISLRFNELVHLKTLFLERNRLTGSVPELNLTLDQFNVSQNNLVGAVPLSLSGYPSSGFEGNSLCGKPLTPCNETETDTKSPTQNETTGADTHAKSIHGNIPKKKLSRTLGTVIVSVVGFLSVIAVAVIISVMRMRRRIRLPKNADAYLSKGGDSGSNELVFLRKGWEVFDLEELLMASAEVLGNGSYGTCYKAMPRNGVVVSVKMLKDVNVKESEFNKRMSEIARMEHGNVVPLVAYYHSKDVKLLVHEYIPKGSLSALLHGDDGAGKARLNWETRCRIALGAAQGIGFIHSLGPTVYHGNIKSSNILLTETYEARTSDFGLGHLVGPNTSSICLGSGYHAPEVIDSRVVSQEADVYSFGVVLLELLTGKDPCKLRSDVAGDVVDLPGWVRSEKWTAEIFDDGLARRGNDLDPGMLQLLQIAFDCTDHHPGNRPTMAEVTPRIENLS